MTHSIGSGGYNIAQTWRHDTCQRPLLAHRKTFAFVKSLQYFGSVTTTAPQWKSDALDRQQRFQRCTNLTPRYMTTTAACTSENVGVCEMISSLQYFGPVTTTVPHSRLRVGSGPGELGDRTVSPVTTHNPAYLYVRPYQRYIFGRIRRTFRYRISKYGLNVHTYWHALIAS